MQPASGIARIYMGSGSSIASFRCPIPHASILPKRRILAFIGSASSTRGRWVNARKRNAAFSPRKSFLSGARGPPGTVDNGYQPDTNVTRRRGRCPGGGVHHEAGVSRHTDGDRSRADVGWNPRVQTEGDFAESLPKRRVLARIESA